MYLHHEIYAINPGWQRELEGRVPRLHQLQARQPGFHSTTFLRHGGNLNRYLALRMWQRREDAQAFGRTPEMQQYLRSRPPEAYARPPDIEYYELAMEEQGTGKPNYVLHAEQAVAPGQGRAWEEWEGQLYPLLKGAAGFHSVRFFRFLGSPNRYLRIVLWDSRDALLRFQETEPFKARMWETEERKTFIEPEGMLC